MTLGGILKLCFSANEHEKALESIDHFARNASKQGHSLEPGPNSKTTSPQSGERRSTTLGLANFLGPGANTLLHSDCQTLAPLFGANLIGTDASVPRCTVLFTYCNLDPTGTLSGTTLGVTDLAASSGAQLVILASPNAPETVVNPTFVHALAGKNVPAPLVITFDRRGEAFSKFFLDLFLRMKAGARMFRAWVDIAPQEPNFVHQGPAIMCVDGPSQMNKPTPQPPRNFTPLTDFLRHSFPGLTEAQAAMLAASRMDSRPGSKTWQALFDEMVAKSADAPGARQVYFQGQLQSGEKTIPVSAIALEFARISHGAFVTIFDTEIGRGVGAIDFSRYDEALKETLRRIGYRRA